MIIFAALLVLGTVIVQGHPRSYDVVCKSMKSDNAYQSYIVGGEPAKVGEFPWMVSLREKNHFCAGSLIAPDVVLTAGHCGPFDIYTRLYMGMMNVNGSDEHEIVRKVKKSVTHYRYINAFSGYDISLIQMDEAVTFSDRVSPICLPPQGTPTTGMTTVAGWGTTSSWGSSSDDLLKVDVPVVSDDDCRNESGYYPSQIKDNMICAGYKAGGKDACQGDSGGPLMKKLDDGSYYQAGIVSWGQGCAKPNYPGVYTEVSYFTEWVEKQLKKFE